MTDRQDRDRHHYAGVRASIAWLHEYATTMNDPHAKAILNTAAHALGVSKPPPAAIDYDAVADDVAARYPKILERLAKAEGEGT